MIILQQINNEPEYEKFPYIINNGFDSNILQRTNNDLKIIANNMREVSMYYQQWIRNNELTMDLETIANNK